MITWLASYPRSGNTLLREVLNVTMGLKSASPYYAAVGTSLLDELVGPIGYDQPFAEFYESAVTASEQVLLKTHDLPGDDDYPAIYVVRDGRAALSSFLRFEREFNAQSVTNSMLRLILGDHHYANWSQHYRAWSSRKKAPTLVVKYTDLVDPSAQTLTQMAEFLGYKGKIGPWNNQIEKLQTVAPTLVGAGNVSWISPPEWDQICDLVFWTLHEECMQELGFDDGFRLPKPSSEQMAESWSTFLQLSQVWLAQNRDWHVLCDKQNKEIDVRGEEIRKLMVSREELQQHIQTMRARPIERVMRAGAKIKRLVVR